MLFDCVFEFCCGCWIDVYVGNSVAMMRLIVCLCVLLGLRGVCLFGFVWLVVVLVIMFGFVVLFVVLDLSSCFMCLVG